MRDWTTLALGCVFACGIAACANPADELYDPLDLPRLPSVPDPGRVNACEACANEKCAAQRAACLEDDSCRELLGCKGGCSHPTCLQQCTAAHGFSAWYDDFWACVLTDECSKPCVSGENFACVGKYEAPKAEQGIDKFPVTLHFKNPRTGLAYAFTGDQRDEQFAVGAKAQSCLPQKSAMHKCMAIASDNLDISNSVTLDVSVHPVARQFIGTFEVELGDLSQAPPDLIRQLAWRDRYMAPPFAQATEFRLYVFSRGSFPEPIDEQTSEVLSADEAAPLAVYLEDCMGVPARGVRIELPGQPGIDVKNQLCEVDSFGEATDCGSAMVGDISDPARQSKITVQAVQVATDKVVAKRTDVFVRAGWATHVWLVPQASQ